jgi:hypothetical protein
MNESSKSQSGPPEGYVMLYVALAHKNNLKRLPRRRLNFYSANFEGMNPVLHAWIKRAGEQAIYFLGR